MASAVAIASAIVAIELAGEFGHRALHFRRRADQLQARLHRVEERLSVAKQEVAEMRRQAELRARFDRILAAPDGKLIRLAAPRGPNAPRAALACSPLLSQVILEVSLPPAPAPRRYLLRWIRRDGSAVPGAEFVAPRAGQAEVALEVAMPPPDARAVTLSALDQGIRGPTEAPLRANLLKAAR